MKTHNSGDVGVPPFFVNTSHASGAGNAFLKG